MKSLSNNLPSADTNINKYIFCPTGICLNIPEIHYLNNPLKTEFSFKCKCHDNNNAIIQGTNLKEFLEQSTNLICFICKKKFFNDAIMYCTECKIILDADCLEIHHKERKHAHYIQLNHNIFNFCLEHKNPYIFRCMNCNQSFCRECNFTSHDDKGHIIEQLKKFQINQNEMDKIKNNFSKQKKYFEKIKEINNNFIQTLENDIKIKERMINNAELNKLDYNSIINMNNMNIQNNEKYEKILSDILNNNDKNDKNSDKSLEIGDYVNNFLSLLYYSLMINKEENINDSIMNELEKKIISINPEKNNPNENSMNVDNHLLKENLNNYYKNQENSKNNFPSLIVPNFTKNNVPNPNNKNNNYSSIDALSDAKTFNKYYNQINPNENMNNNKNEFNFDENNPNQIFDSNTKNYANLNFSLQNTNINNLNLDNNKYNNSSSSLNKSNSKKNKHSNLEIAISQTSSEKSNDKKQPKKTKSPNNKNSKKAKKEIPKKEQSNLSVENQEISESDSKRSERKNNNYINNMIILKSGNIAISKKEAIEIYDLSKLNFTDANFFYDNKLIQDFCLLQVINLVRGRKISYVFELFDETLLCATYAKIFRIKLTNNNKGYEIMSFLKIGVSELPTKIISLDKSYLVILSEQKMNCNIKLFQKIDDIKDSQNNSSEDKINNQSKEESNKSNNKNEINSNLNNCSDVPAIGNCGLFVNKEAEEDKTFELIHKNINEIRKLWVSIHPIIKKEKNKNDDNINNEDDDYLYEFITTSNKIYDYGVDKLVFFGLKKGKNDKIIVKKIIEINGLSCSAEADSICQINEKYLCVGLQNHNLNGQISGFAFIDVDKRNLARVIWDQEISCMYYNPINNLLFSSMEVRDFTRNYFATKIYRIMYKKSDKGNEELELKEIFKHKNNQKDIITSIQQIEFKKENLLDNIIFVTSSKDSTLEVVKAKINE